MICNPTVAHPPHTMERGPHKGEQCDGVTTGEVVAQQRRKQEAIASRAHMFVTRYGIDVSARSLQANPRIWEQVEKAIDREYLRGLKEGRAGQ